MPGEVAAKPTALRLVLTDYEAPPIDHHRKVLVAAPIAACSRRTLGISAEAKEKRTDTTPDSIDSKRVCKHGGS